MYGLKKTFFKPVFLTNHNCSFNLKFSMIVVSSPVPQ